MLPNLQKSILRCVLAIFSLALLALLAACAPNTPEGGCSPGETAIYLPAESMNGAQMLRADPAKIVLQSEPIIHPEDILSYGLRTRELRLSQEAMQRLTELKVPLNGLGFVICADGQAVIGGAFWTPISSLFFEGVTIMQPFETDQPAVVLNWSNVSQPVTLRDDPRDDPRLISALDKAGKLK